MTKTVKEEETEDSGMFDGFNVNLPEMVGFLMFALIMMGMIWGYNVHTDDINAELFKSCVQNHRTISYTSDGKLLCK